jgi:hypothetical protein
MYMYIDFLCQTSSSVVHVILSIVCILLCSLVIGTIGRISRFMIRGGKRWQDSRLRMAAAFGIHVGNTSACLALFKVLYLFDDVVYC